MKNLMDDDDILFVKRSELITLLVDTYMSGAEVVVNMINTSVVIDSRAVRQQFETRFQTAPLSKEERETLQ